MTGVSKAGMPAVPTDPGRHHARVGVEPLQEPPAPSGGQKQGSQETATHRQDQQLVSGPLQIDEQGREGPPIQPLIM